jgi:hypothetical protein
MDTLDRLVAIDEIQQLKARYFRTLDLRDWDGMAQVFAKDAVFDFSVGMQIAPLGGKPEGPVGPIIRGRDAIIAWVRQAYADHTAVHHGHCHEVTIDSETEAHGVIAMNDLIRDASRTKTLLSAAGHYWERYHFEDGQWRIAHTRLTRLFNDVDPDGFYTAGVDDPADNVVAE